MKMGASSLKALLISICTIIMASNYHNSLAYLMRLIKTGTQVKWERDQILFIFKT